MRQREVLQSAGIQVPEFFSFRLTEKTSTKFCRECEFPCVVKPLSLAASQGVIRANNAEEFDRCRGADPRPVGIARDSSACGNRNLDRVLVEKYIPGREVAVEGLMDAGRLRVLAIFDKPDPLEGPYFEETIYVTPSRLPARRCRRQS